MSGAPPSKAQALPGREAPLSVEKRHALLGTDMSTVPADHEVVLFGMGCFWGAERKFWNIPGVHSTAVGYAGGHTPNPTYEEVCSGQTAHTEVVQVVFAPARASFEALRGVSFEALLGVFWESHDPTQGMRQGADRGTQYRSAIYCSTADQLARAQASAQRFQEALLRHGRNDITTEISDSRPFYFAETYHQQYLHKNPRGYCGLGGTGVTCPVGPA
ncbi:MAG: Peptide methionine sulfoxide reductase MsrA [Pseudomonadota bacterium]|jgi:peptide-methionine (S)-S-oxide reductase